MRLNSPKINIKLDSSIIKHRRNSLNLKLKNWKSKKDKRKELFRLLNQNNQSTQKRSISYIKPSKKFKKKHFVREQSPDNLLILKGSSMGQKHRKYPDSILNIVKKSKIIRKHQSKNNTFYNLKNKFFYHRLLRKKDLNNKKLDSDRQKCEMLKILHNKKKVKNTDSSINKIISISKISKGSKNIIFKNFIKR
jgi:hypothetical protein